MLLYFFVKLWYDKEKLGGIRHENYKISTVMFISWNKREKDIYQYIKEMFERYEVEYKILEDDEMIEIE